jgi:DNA-binding transcriptional LysR family regulator
MKFKGLDMNLLVALDALIETRSVIGASKRLNLSQPATSAALARLRRHFQDELLIADSKSMHPTEGAQILAPQVKACLKAAEGLVSMSTGFDPMTCDRVFKIGASDFLIASVFAPLAKTLAVEAPQMRFKFFPPDRHASEALDRGDLDLLMLPIDFIRSRQPTKLLFEERYVIIGDKRHPIFEDGVTEESVFAYPHISVGFGPEVTPSFGDRHLDRIRRSRTVDAWLPNFTAVPLLLLGTQRLAVMHERLARSLSEVLPVEYRPPPFPFPTHKQVVQRHEARTDDLGLTWLMDAIAAEVAT